MDWAQPVDLYCERTSAAFWAEPVNAVSNIAFLIAALLAFLRWQKTGASDMGVLALIVVVTLVGLGSFAFHTLATRGAMLLDVAPIGLFIYGYLGLSLCRYLRLPLMSVLAIVIVFIALTQGLIAVVPRETLNGAVGYLPALAALFVVAALGPAGGVRRGLLLAAVIFIASLAARIVDLDVCPAFPVGTHFLWHLLNAAVLYVLLHTAMMTRAAP